MVLGIVSNMAGGEGAQRGNGLAPIGQDPQQAVHQAAGEALTPVPTKISRVGFY